LIRKDVLLVAGQCCYLYCGSSCKSCSCGTLYYTVIYASPNYLYLCM